MHVDKYLRGKPWPLPASLPPNSGTPNDGKLGPGFAITGGGGDRDGLQQRGAQSATPGGVALAIKKVKKLNCSPAVLQLLGGDGDAIKMGKVCKPAVLQLEDVACNRIATTMV